MSKEIIFGEVFDVRNFKDYEDSDDIDIFECSTPYTFFISCGDFKTLPFGMNCDGGNFYYCGFKTKKQAESVRQKMLKYEYVVVISEMINDCDPCTFGIVEKVFKNPEKAYNYLLKQYNNDNSVITLQCDLDGGNRLIACIEYPGYLVELKQFD